MQKEVDKTIGFDSCADKRLRQLDKDQRERREKLSKRRLNSCDYEDPAVFGTENDRIFLDVSDFAPIDANTGSEKPQLPSFRLQSKENYEMHSLDLHGNDLFGDCIRTPPYSRVRLPPRQAPATPTNDDNASSSFSGPVFPVGSPFISLAENFAVLSPTSSTTHCDRSYSFHGEGFDVADSSESPPQIMGPNTSNRWTRPTLLPKVTLQPRSSNPTFNHAVLGTFGEDDSLRPVRNATESTCFANPITSEDTTLRPSSNVDNHDDDDDVSIGEFGTPRNDQSTVISASPTIITARPIPIKPSANGGFSFGSSPIRTPSSMRGGQPALVSSTSNNVSVLTRVAHLTSGNIWQTP